MSDARKKPLWPWIVALLIGLPVLYVASFGPACWLVRQQRVNIVTVARLYRPLVHTACSDSILAPPLHRYADAFRPKVPQGQFVSIASWMNLALQISDTIEPES